MARSLILMELPNELLARVFNDDLLDVDDLISLRLTCKEIHSFVTREFAKRYFTKICVMVSRYSLQALVDICAHSVLGSYVRKIQLEAIRFDPSVIPILAENIQDSYARESLEDVSDAACALQVYAARCQEEYALEETGEATRLLIRALDSLSKHGNPVQLAANDLHSESVLGRSRPPNSYGFEYHMRSTVEILIRAACGTACTISGLDIAAEEYRGPEDEASYIEIGSESKAVFMQMKELILRLDYEPPETTMLSFERALQASKNLQRLHLAVGYDYGHDWLVDADSVDEGNRVLAAVRSNKIQDFSFSHAACSQKSLISALKHRKLTLRKIKLDCLGLRWGAWKSVSLWIRDNIPGLQEICLKELYHLNGDSNDGVLGTGERFISEIHLRGREEIQVGLSNLA